MKSTQLISLKNVIFLFFFTMVGSCTIAKGQAISRQLDSASLFQEAKKVIAQANNSWLVAIRHGDFKTVAAPYGKDGIYVSPGGQCYMGALQIEKYHRQSAKALAALKDITLVQEGITMVDAFVYEWGRVDFYIGSKAKASPKLSGRYLTVWKKNRKNKWQISRNLALP